MIRTIRDFVANRLVDTARQLSSDAGWSDMSAHLGVPSMRAGLQRLRDHGVVLKTVVDVGACVGHWTLLLRTIYPHAAVVMVEPQQRHQAALRTLCTSYGPGLQVEHALLGPPGRTSAIFHITEDGSEGTGSSVLPENSNVPRRVESMPMTTLDELLLRNDIQPPDLVKLDVQGYELEVLKGANRTLSHAPLVLLEVSFWPYNTGAPLLHDVLQWMHEVGYRAYDVLDLSRRPDDVLVQADLLFAHRQSPLLADSITRFSVL